MKTIVVFSDTHGSRNTLYKAKNIVKEADYVVHLGDGVNDLTVFSEQEDFFNKVHAVDGNNDAGVTCKKNDVLEVENIRFLLTHGDQDLVKFGFEKIVEHANRENCNAVLYGHTHFADIRTVDGIMLINPGKVCYGMGSNSLAYIVVNDKKIVASINKKIFE